MLTGVCWAKGCRGVIFCKMTATQTLEIYWWDLSQIQKKRWPHRSQRLLSRYTQMELKHGLFNRCVTWNQALIQTETLKFPHVSDPKDVCPPGVRPEGFISVVPLRTSLKLTFESLKEEWTFFFWFLSTHMNPQFLHKVPAAWIWSEWPPARSRISKPLENT